MKTILFLLLIISCILLCLSKQFKEGFLGDYCAKNNNCKDCSSASGCSWCPNSNVCLTSTSLKSTDKTCNQMNTISSSFNCTSVSTEPPHDSNDVMYDFSLYKNRITDKIPPPNLYMAGEVQPSPADILSNMNNIRNDIANYKLEMPGIISSAVENQIKPMVKGVLSENYYIQGFEDINQGQQDAKKCTSYNSCSACVTNKSCGWDPRRYGCDKLGPNNLWQITQPTRCVLTPGTQSLMLTNPA